MPTKALVATRHLLRAALQRSFEQQLDAEREWQAALGRTHDYLEGEKRTPRFRGG